MLAQWRTEGLQRPGANAWIGPPRLVNPASAPGEKNRQAKKGLQHEKVERPREIGALESSGPIAYATFATRLIQHCNEVTLLICLGLIFFLKFAPTSWAGAPSKACARGPWPPLPPPVRHCAHQCIIGICDVNILVTHVSKILMSSSLPFLTQKNIPY